MTSQLLKVGAIAVAIVFGFSVRTDAHHSFAAQFDGTKSLALSGVVTKVDWTNPHIWFYMDVKDPVTARVTNWALEMGSPNSVLRLGWTRNSLKPGQTVTVRGFVAKDGSNTANAVDVVLPDGRKVLAGSSSDSVLPH